MPDTLGIYIHVPFCSPGKCPYCDFYSVPLTAALAERYLEAAERCLREWGARAAGRAVDTVYLGGGTPSLLGDGLCRLLSAVREAFDIAQNAEITLEANPGSVEAGAFARWRAAGFNRVSLGMQSAVPEELCALGRRHTPRQVEEAVRAARAAGFANLSLDLMLCTPGQTPESMRRSIGFAAALAPEHISAYLLKVEEGTPFFLQKNSLRLPDDDAQAEAYLSACRELERRGYEQYEISNFARPGFASRHNLRYWNTDEYLGVGPAAHSFFNGQRFHYERSLPAFLSGAAPVPDGAGGTLEEYVMLRLRLSEGLWESALRERFGADFSLFGSRPEALAQGGLLTRAPGRIALTARGFLVSNAVIGSLLFG